MGSLPKLALIVCASLSPSAVLAQSQSPLESERDGPLFRSDVAGSRQLRGQEPIGVHIGSFAVLPSVSVRATGDSNVFKTSNAKSNDVYVVFEPAIKVSSDWAQHDFVARANAAVAKFATIPSQNSTTYGVGMAARVDIAAKTSSLFGMSFDRLAERRGSATESGLTGSPAEYEQLKAQLGVKTETGKVRVATALTATQLRYFPIDLGKGKVGDQSFRNANILGGSLKAEYALPSAAVVFVDANIDRIWSTKATDCCDRSAWGGRFTAGIHTDLGNLITAEIALGYGFRTYDFSAFKDYGGLAYRATVDWYPTPLISARISTDRQILSSGLPGAAGVISSSAKLEVFYELRRTVNLGFNISSTLDDYRDTDAAASSLSIGVDARYAVRDRLLAGLFGRYSQRKTNGSELVHEFNGLEGGLWLRYSM
jgi:hypothetical protein